MVPSLVVGSLDRDFVFFVLLTYLHTYVLLTYVRSKIGLKYSYGGG